MDYSTKESIELRQVSSQLDLIQILELQQNNLSKAVSIEERKAEGFVSVEHDLETLSLMNSPHPHIIARDGDALVGYCLVMLQEMRDHIDLLKPMFAVIDNQSINGKSLKQIQYLVMGQVCVHKAYRGQGVFYKMYDHMRAVMNEAFDVVITEISSQNTRSLRAHEKQGFRSLYKFTDPITLHPWEIVYWDWR